MLTAAERALRGAHHRLAEIADILRRVSEKAGHRGDNGHAHAVMINMNWCSNTLIEHDDCEDMAEIEAICPCIEDELVEALLSVRAEDRELEEATEEITAEYNARCLELADMGRELRHACRLISKLEGWCEGVRNGAEWTCYEMEDRA